MTENSAKKRRVIEEGMCTSCDVFHTTVDYMLDEQTKKDYEEFLTTLEKMDPEEFKSEAAYSEDLANQIPDTSDSQVPRRRSIQNHDYQALEAASLKY
jgi:hypothetical protein